MENEYELVCLAQEDNQQAIDILYNLYKPVIKFHCNKVMRWTSYHGIDLLDYMQEGYLGLESAIRHYSQDSKASFYTFAVMCIKRKIMNLYRKATNNRNYILNRALLIDEMIENTVKDNSNVEEFALSGWLDYDYTNKIRMTLTNLERNIFDLRIYGYNSNELAKVLDIDKKSVYNALQRIKVKIKNNYLEEL